MIWPAAVATQPGRPNGLRVVEIGKPARALKARKMVPSVGFWGEVFMLAYS
jgi:hypothetical protein